MNIRSTVVLSLAAGTFAAVSAADVVIQPIAVSDLSTWRSCVPPENIYNGAGLSDATGVLSGSPIPAAWPTHETFGCGNMWHTSCLGQPNGTECEGGDLTPYIVFDLGTPWDLSGFHIWNHNQMPPGTGNETDRGLRNITVQVSADGVSYSSAVPFTDMLRAPGSTAYAGDDYGLPATNVRYVKFTVQNNWGSTAATGISELRFMGTSRLALVDSAVSPAEVGLCGPQNVVVSTRVVAAPTGTLQSVVLSGGSLAGTVVMHDDGVNGDAAAGDNIFSATVTVPADFAQGDSTFTINTSDTAGHTSASSATMTVGPCIPTYTEVGDADQMPATASVISGTGELARIRGTLTNGDIDMYKITICEPIAFSATLIGGSDIDTQMFIFDADGHGVVYDDDTNADLPGGYASQSTIIGGIATPGDYYIAITGWDKDPVNASGEELFQDDPYDIQHVNDGDGGADPIAGWNGNYNTNTGPYVVTLTGACFVEVAPPACVADLGSAGGLPGSDGQLDNNDFIAFISYFFNQDPHADLGVAGGLPGSDGDYNNNDFIAFINFFFQGCPH